MAVGGGDARRGALGGDAVARGVRSRLYKHGRYSPSRERGVHHFHRLVCEFLH